MRADVALLEWYREMGVDEAVSDTPTDWSTMSGYRMEPLAPARPAAAIPRAAADARPLPPHAAPERAMAAAPRVPLSQPDAGVMAARARAGAAASLAELRAALAEFEGCALKATAKNLCFYRGAEQARLMLIGEAPGREEDLEGRPFVGRAGQLLDKMLAAIGLSEAQVHITNVVYWRPPGNRTPTPQETEACRPFLARQIELVAPLIILCLGGAAAKHVLGVSEGIMKLRGRWLEYRAEGRPVRTMATLHPAYLLRTPAAKRLAWRDLLAVRAALGGNDGGAMPSG